ARARSGAAGRSTPSWWQQGHQRIKPARAPIAESRQRKQERRGCQGWGLIFGRESKLYEAGISRRRGAVRGDDADVEARAAGDDAAVCGMVRLQLVARAERG